MLMPVNCGQFAEFAVFSTTMAIVYAREDGLCCWAVVLNESGWPQMALVEASVYMAASGPCCCSRMLR